VFHWKSRTFSAWAMRECSTGKCSSPSLNLSQKGKLLNYCLKRFWTFEWIFRYITTYKLYRIKSKEHGCVVFETEVLRRYLQKYLRNKLIFGFNCLVIYVMIRFSDFEWLYNELINKYGGYLIPVLPEKNILTKFNVETNDFTKDR